MEQAEFESEADRLLALAESQGVTLRLLGALAFKKRCPNHAYLQAALGRRYTDVDLAGYGREVKEIRRLLGRDGFLEDEMTFVESEGSRMVLHHPVSGLHLDVFLDKLAFCHTVSFDGRLATDRWTIPLAEMLMQKMQIVEINEKDIIDTIMLLLEHPLGERDEDTVNIGLVARVCAKDWGWWRTLTMNLGKVKQMAAAYPQLGPDETRRVAEQVDQALERIEREPKSMAWRMRARIGDRKRWYRDVGELGPVMEQL
jgi:hypothetical protein